MKKILQVREKGKSTKRGQTYLLTVKSDISKMSYATYRKIVIADYPHHIIQRGHNKQVVFAGDEDYIYYLENLKELNICR